MGSVTVVTPFLLVGFLPHVVRSGVPLNRGKLQLSSLANRLYPKKSELKKNHHFARCSFLIYSLCIFFMYVMLSLNFSITLSFFFKFTFYLPRIHHSFSVSSHHPVFFFFFFSKIKRTFTFVSLFARFCSVSLALISLPTGEMFPFRFRLSNVSKPRR